MLPTLLTFASCSSDDGAARDVTGDVLTVGQQIPDFDVTLLDGTHVSAASLQGRPTVLCFFHTLCGDCQRELPVLQTIYDEHRTRANFLCIARHEGAKRIAAFWDENHLTLPVAPQDDDSIFRLFATTYIPRIYLLTPAGTIQQIHRETLNADTLRAALAEYPE